MALRVKTVWFRKDGGEQRPAREVASVLSSTIWRLADRTVDGLSKAEYDILTPERGVRIVGEMAAFLLHMSDRMVRGRIPEAERGTLIQVTASRLADLVVENIRALVVDDGFDYRANFIDMLNRRGADYAGFECDPAKPSFQVLRYLALAIREVMVEADQHWVADQIMEIQAPEALGTLKKTIDGFYPPARRAS
jgi:hypothetical protein